VLIEGNAWLGLEGLGYPAFFVVCAITSIPGFFLLAKVAPWRGKRTDSGSGATRSEG